MASLARWHEHHAAAIEAVARVDRLVAHTLLETVSVMTRLPAGLAQPLSVIHEIVRREFPGDLLLLPGPGYSKLLSSLQAVGLRGGAVYDGLIGATARHHDARLVSLDRRAEPVYRAVGAEVELLG